MSQDDKTVLKRTFFLTSLLGILKGKLRCVRIVRLWYCTSFTIYTVHYLLAATVMS